MRYGFLRPATTISLSGTNSPSFATDVRLTNSQPSEQTVIRGFVSPVPSTSDHVQLNIVLNGTHKIGAFALLNLSCPEGTRIELGGRRASSPIDNFMFMGGNTTTQKVAELPDGRKQAILICDPPYSDFVELRLRIFNNVNGVPWANENTELRIGEVAPFVATYLKDTPARKSSRSSRSVKERAFNAAVHLFRRGEFRTGEWDIHGSLSEAFKNSLDLDRRTPLSLKGACWAKFRAMQDDPLYRALIIPRGEGDYGTAPDYDLIQQLSMFCVVSWGDIQEEDRGIFYANATLSAEEAP